MLDMTEKLPASFQAAFGDTVSPWGVSQLACARGQVTLGA